MIPRRLQETLRSLLAENPAVALLGPRQVGKTTLALEIAETFDATYLDLESQADRAKLSEPELYLVDHEDRLVILDEVHRLPDLFQSLRGLIDRGRRKGRRAWRFLLLGSASMDLLKQSGETVWSAVLVGDRSEGVSARKAWKKSKQRRTIPVGYAVVPAGERCARAKGSDCSQAHYSLLSMLSTFFNSPTWQALIIAGASLSTTFTRNPSLR